MPKSSYVIALPLGVRLVLTSDSESAVAAVRLRQSRLESLRPLLLQVANLLRADARRQFAEGGDPAWKPLAPSTIMAKQSAGLPARLPSGRIPRRLMQGGGFGGSSSILIATGAYRDSWGRLGAAGNVSEIDEAAGTVEVGSDLPVAIFMQRGTRPHVISPKAGGVLAFMGAAGRVVTPKPVNHPGTAPRPVVITSDARRKIAEAAEDYFAADARAGSGGGGAGYDFSPPAE